MYASDSSSNLSEVDEGSLDGSCRTRRVDVDVLRRICACFHITGTPAEVLKSYVRLDGSPVVPGVDWDGVDSPDRQEAWKRFMKSLWKNTKTAVNGRMQYPKKSKHHTNSLPRDFSLHHYLRPRRSLLNSPFPDLPEWTEDHYQSQFARMVAKTIDVNALVEKFCFAKFGEVDLIAIDTEVDGKKVDFHLKLAFDQRGHFSMKCGDVSFQGLRVPRGYVEDGKSFDIVAFSAVNRDTSRPSSHVSSPYTLGQDNRKMFCEVVLSTDHEVKYAEARVERSKDSVSQATLLSEQAFCTELAKVKDERVSYCIELENASFIPGLLQDEELLQYFPNGITTERTVAKGGVTDPAGMKSRYSLHGFDWVLAIDGRTDELKKLKTKEDFLAEQMKRIKISEANESKKKKMKQKPLAPVPPPVATTQAPVPPVATTQAPVPSAATKKKKKPRAPVPPPVATTQAPVPPVATTQAPVPSAATKKKKKTRAPVPPPVATTQAPVPSAATKKKKKTRAPVPPPVATTQAPVPPVVTTQVPVPSTRNASATAAAPLAAGSINNTKQSNSVRKKSSRKRDVTNPAASPTPTAAPNGKGKDYSGKTNTAATAKANSEATITPATPSVASTRRNEFRTGIVSDGSSNTENSEYRDVDGKELFVHKANGDGDCLFHSLNRNNSSEDAKALRNHLVQQMLSNQAHYENILGSRYSDVLLQVVNTGEACGDEAIQLFVDMTGYYVLVFVAGASSEYTRVFSPSDDDPDFVSARPTGETLYLLYDNINHYDFLLPADDEEDDSDDEEDDSDDEEDDSDDEEDDSDDEEDDSDDEEDDSDDEEDDSDDEEGGDQKDEDDGDEESEYDGSNEAGGEEEEESDDDVGFDDDDDLSEGEEQVHFGFPDIGMGVDGTRAQAGFSGSFDDDDDDISIPHERAASSPSGSPVERILNAAKGAAQSAVSLGLNFMSSSPRADNNLRPEKLSFAFGSRRSSSRSTKGQRSFYSPS